MSEMLSPEEILARRLDQVLPPDKASVPPQTPDPLVNTAARIAVLSIPEPLDMALARMENTMLAAFDQQYRVQRQPKQSRRWVSQASRWAAAASLILALLMAGIVPASAGSLPGEPLYSVKRLTERVELALAANGAAIVRLRLAHAERRALEALALLERDQFDAALLDEARAELKSVEQAVSPELGTSLTFQWQHGEVTDLIQFVVERAEEPADSVVAPADSLVQTDTMTPTYTASPTPTVTATPTHTYTASPSPTDIRMPAHTSHPTRMPDTATYCPGNSCNSAGVPGGQIDPNNPPGQSGGRNNNPPDPPGQGVPGGGQGGNSGQGNSGNSGGGAPAEPPPSNSGGNSGNRGGGSGK